MITSMAPRCEFFLVIFLNCLVLGASQLLYGRQRPLDLNLEDNLLTIGGVDYPYFTAVLSTSANSEAPEPPQLKYTAPGQEETVETCLEEYRGISDHTMCLPDSPKVIYEGVTVADREIILSEHNHYRSTTEPPAEDMQKMIWDENLAQLAQKWVKQCIVGHDAGKAREVPGYGVFLGQSAAGGYKTWVGAIKGWYKEVEEYRYGEDPQDYVTSKAGVGHYVQMVQNTTVLVGCGYAECVDSTYRRYFVCNYVSGNADRPAYPYRNGTRCKQCPGHCVDGLCDCGGKYCFNGGKLDVTSCKCKCKSIYDGEDCMALTCPENDKWYCGQEFPPSYCEKYGNTKYSCPYMCGLCHSVKMAYMYEVASTDGPLLFMSDHGCVHRGPRATPDKCMKLGSRGRDREDCRTEGGFYTCDDCWSAAVRNKHCPVMCGVCDPPCDGMRCQNGGTLKPETCTCNCLPNFSGELCQNFTCPESDISGCAKKFTLAQCQEPNAKSKCPYYCDHCQEILPCEGKLCRNRAKLNKTSCRCECKHGYIGDICQEFVCPEADLKKCNKKTEDDCTDPSTADDCPYFCDRCNSDSTTMPPTTVSRWAQTVEPGTFRSVHGCLYSGDRPDQDACLTYGDQGLDLSVCHSQGGEVTCDTCDNPEVERQCPVMCGVCDPPCLAKTCKNGGQLNVLTCECSCTYIYMGDRCENLFCPVGDSPSCEGKDQAQCSQEPSLSADCPYLCVLCSQDKCVKKGLRGFDKSTCETEGGSLGCSSCGSTVNQCPVMCGACDSPCGDKTCMNGGSLKIDGTCGCKCPSIYTGHMCQTLVCPDKEKSLCGAVMESECDSRVDLRVDCPYLCGLCVAPSTTTEAPTSPRPSFTSDHGCVYEGERPGQEKCLNRGVNGFDRDTCQTNKGSAGCSDCPEPKTQSACPVMCGLCDPPCGDQVCLSGGRLKTDGTCDCKCPTLYEGETCQTYICGNKTCLNGGELKEDGSCECKCPTIYSGEMCETLACPKKDKKLCREKSESDCTQKSDLWEDCPFLCGVCEEPPTTPPPTFVSEHGCSFVGERPDPSKCRKYGKKGLDLATCASEGGDYGCDDCVAIDNDCPVMCGLCDPPCGGKRCNNEGKLDTSTCLCSCPANFNGDTCQINICGNKTCLNGGELKEDGSCECKCPTIYSGEMCETLACPKKDKKLCLEKLESDCTQDSDLWEDCPFLCGVCEEPPTTPPPTFVSEHGCSYVGERPDPLKCRKYGKKGLDLATCASEGGDYGCDDCVAIDNDCPVMCGLCDPPCGDERCVNGGKLDTRSCTCTCLDNYTGDTCDQVDCPEADMKKCGSKFLLVDCADPATISKCPYMCGVCML